MLRKILRAILAHAHAVTQTVTVLQHDPVTRIANCEPRARGLPPADEVAPNVMAKRMNFLDCPHGEEQSIFYGEADTSDNTD